MSFKQFLNEAETISITDKKPAVISPGRFNPPTKGHGLMIGKLMKLATELKAEPIIIVVDSEKYDEKNPLTGSVRAEFLKKQFPHVRIEIAKNPYLAVEKLAEHGFYPVGGVTGSDRADSYKKMVGRMFGPEVESNYKAEVITRDPDAEGTSGISATKARNAAKENDKATFRSMVGVKEKDADDLMKLVRKGMGLE